MQFWTIIVDGFRESIDRTIFWVLLALTGVVVLAMLCVGFHEDKVTFLFGAYEFESSFYNPDSVSGRRSIAGWTIYVILDMILGWIGMILMLIATGSMFPNMLRKGQIDTLLAKPIGRPRLFLYKYLASMVFVFVQTSIFVVVTFFVMGFRWKVWVPGYLLSIFLMVLLFSYLYCVSALVAVHTRSTISAILLSMGMWVVYWAPPTSMHALETFGNSQDSRMYASLRVVRMVLPKTDQIPFLAAQWAGAGTSLDSIPEKSLAAGNGQVNQKQLEIGRRWEEEQLRTSWVKSIGSSLLFEACIVGAAMWSFCRKDF